MEIKVYPNSFHACTWELLEDFSAGIQIIYDYQVLGEIFCSTWWQKWKVKASKLWLFPGTLQKWTYSTHVCLEEWHFNIEFNTWV